jgi:hypothetical protein
MNMQRRISFFIGIALLFTTASFAQQVKTDYDRSTDFSQYKTTPGKTSTHKTRCGSIESRRLSIQRWQRRVGLRLNLVGMFPSWRWR